MMKFFLLLFSLVIVFNAYSAILKTETAAWQINPETGALSQVQRQSGKGVIVKNTANHYFLMKKSGDAEAFESEDRVISKSSEGNALIFNCVNPKLKDIIITKKYWVEKIYLRREITYKNNSGETAFITPRTRVIFDENFFEGGFYLGSGYIGPLIPAPAPQKPQKETRYKQSTKGMLLYHEPEKGSFAQYRTALNGKFVFPWFQSAIPSYLEKDNYLFYMPNGWEMSLSTIDVLPGKTFSIEDSFVFFHGSWYDFMNDIYVNDPEVSKVLKAFNPGPKWLSEVKVYVGYRTLKELRQILELVDEGEIMVLVDVLGNWADYRVWDNGRCGQLGGFIRSEEMKKVIADIKALSPRIKIGIYNWISSAGITSPVFKTNPEYFMIKDRDGRDKNFFPGDCIQNYTTMINRRETADYVMNMFAGVIEHLGVDYIYLDETKTFNLIDWERNDMVRDDHWYDIWDRMKDLGTQTNTVMFGNGRANPYSDLNFVEARHQLRPIVWREFVGMGMAVSAFTNHRPGGRICLLYWNPNLDYISRVMANGFIPAINSLRYQQIPFLTANAEIGKTSILNMKYTPDWKSDPKTELETYSSLRELGGENIFSIINRAESPKVKIALNLPEKQPFQIWEYKIDRYQDGASLPYGLGEKDIRANYRKYRWREGLATQPRLLYQGVSDGKFNYESDDFEKNSFRQLVISSTPAGIYSVNDMPCNYFFSSTTKVKLSGTKFPIKVDSQVENAEIILFCEPGNITVNGQETPVEYAEFDGKLYPLVKVGKGLSEINIQGKINLDFQAFNAVLKDGKLKIEGTPELLTIKRNGKLLYCGNSPALPKYRPEGEIELDTPAGTSPIKLHAAQGDPTAAMSVKAPPKQPAIQKINDINLELDGVTITSEAVYTSAWEDSRNIQPGTPPFFAEINTSELQLQAGTTNKIADYFGHAYAGLLLNGAKKIQFRLEHTFLTGGGILRAHTNRYSRTAYDFAGIMLDYRTPKGFYRVALSMGVITYNGNPGIHPWGSKKKADRVIDLGKLVNQAAPKTFSLDLQQYAPPNWTGEVWFTAGTSRVCPGRSLKITLERFNENASAPVLKGTDCADLKRNFHMEKKLYVPLVSHGKPDAVKSEGANIPYLFTVGNKGLPSLQTSAAIARDEKNLYVVIDYQETIKDYLNELEIWLNPASRKVFQIRILANKNLEVLRNGINLWDSQVKMEQIGPERYFVEIPFEFLGKLEHENELKFNICRMRPANRTDERELSTWAPLQRSFVEVNNFGTLLFEKPTVQTEVFNCGKGGYAASQIAGRYLSNALQNKPTLTILMIGTNDMVNSSKLAAYDVYENNLLKIINRLKNSGSQIILVTIPPCIEPLLFRRHKKEAFGDETPNERINKANNIIKKIAEHQNIPLYDLHQAIIAHAPLESAESLLRNPINVKSADGVHLTPTGAEILGKGIAEIVRKNQMNSQRIVCLGDSNTYGAGLKGAGTTSEETYPAILLKELTTK